MSDNGGREENDKVWTICKDWDETNVSEGNTINKKKHLSHHNNLSFQNELLFFSDGHAYHNKIHPARVSLIDPLLTRERIQLQSVTANL